MNYVLAVPRNQRSGAISRCIWIVSFVVLANVKAGEQNLGELRSPTGKYSVNLISSSLPTSDPDMGTRAIVVSNGKTALAKYPTIGYLLDGFWSADGKYVAIDNRRGNNGDYLWVFRLADGRAMWAPDFKNVLTVADRVSVKFPDLTAGKIKHGYITANGWESDSVLKIRTQLTYVHVDDSLALVDGLYRITDDGLTLVRETIVRPTQPSKVDRE